MFQWFTKKFLAVPSAREGQRFVNNGSTVSVEAAQNEKESNFIYLSFLLSKKKSVSYI